MTQPQSSLRSVPIGSSPDPANPPFERLLAGDGPTLDAWLGEEHKRVYRLCLGFLAEATEAEDVAQEAMLRLLDKLEEGAKARDYRAWSGTLILNLCRDRRRRGRTRSDAEAQASVEHSEGFAPDPIEELERRETESTLLATLERLTPREREAFVLHDLEERPTAEVARVLGIGESTVRTLLSLARGRLRRVLGPVLRSGDGHA